MRRYARTTRRIPWSLPSWGLVLWLFPATVGGADDGAARRWYGADGKELPFATEDEVVEFLATAPVVERKQVGRGIGGVLKLTLERDGVTAHAAFRSVDVERSNMRSGGTIVDRHMFRDHYSFEVAAYRLNRLLGLDRVPPTTVRRIDGRQGSLQLWIEGAMTEADMIESGAGHIDAARHVQRQTMLVFDNLIYNFDRHQNNMLYDESGRLWYIDHTRSFKRIPELPDLERIAVCDRVFLERLRAADEEVLRRELKPYLDPLELQGLVQRRKLLLEHFDALIADRGEAAVLVN
jgi:hypothetical protein